MWEFRVGASSLSPSFRLVQAFDGLWVGPMDVAKQLLCLWSHGVRLALAFRRIGPASPGDFPLFERLISYAAFEL